MRFLILANPDSKRWELFSQELTTFCREQGLNPQIELIPWKDVVARHGNLDGLSVFDQPALVRIESPGRDWDVTRLLLQAGSDDGSDWSQLPYRKGWLVRPGQLHRGFVRVLQGLRTSFDRRPHLRPLACPLAIAEMFDKNATAARLTAAGIPTPPSLTAPADADELLDLLKSIPAQTVYAKLATSSSATGIAVVHPHHLEPFAITSLVQLPEGFHNTRQLIEVRGRELHDTLQFILDEGSCVQHGIPMAQIDGMNFDVRVIVIHGAVAFTIFRLSSAPMTNLHLGGRRGVLETCRAGIPRRVWLDALDDCIEAARLYSSSMVGVDLLFERGYYRHYILELNAFGDFFPGLTDEAGRSVHRRQIEAMTTIWS